MDVAIRETSLLEPLRIERSRTAAWVKALASPGDAREAEANATGLRLGDGRAVVEISYIMLRSVLVRRGAFWSSLVIDDVDGQIVVSGLDHDEAAAFAVQVEQLWTAAVEAALRPHADALARIAASVEGPRRYASVSRMATLLRSAERLVAHLPQSLPKAVAKSETGRRVALVRACLADPEAMRAKVNAAFVRLELERAKTFLDEVETHPLTEAQRQAVVVDEDRNLVVAAAGSGKTSVIVAKAGHLIISGARRPQELLLLAYSNAAAKEMSQRLRKQLGPRLAQGVTVRTFHALGLAILGQAEGGKPALAKVAEDRTTLKTLLRDTAVDLMSNPAFAAVMIRWFQSQFTPYKSAFDFESWAEYWNYVRSSELRTLKGDLVKSFEECEIANFLFLNGVPYEYEAPYPYDVASADKRRYQPDFTLTEHGIYIEHFALSRDGRTPPFINQAEYLAGVAWKRDIHRRFKTTLIETYSYQKSSGRLIEALTAALTERDVIFQPLSVEEALETLRAQGRIDAFSSLIATFLQHFKAGRWTVSALRKKAKAFPDGARATAFLDAFAPILACYETRLAARREIDFTDMIARATDHVEAGHFISPYAYILVDEFQDISADRARLLKALLDQRLNAQLFAVGDDWQAVFRFAGSDISIMRRFADWFGPTARTDLGQTFRCPDRLAAAATCFVLQNPTQLQKDVVSARSVAGPCIHIGLASDGETDLLREALDRIAQEGEDAADAASVLVLGRYNHLEPDDLKSLAAARPRLHFSYATVHKAKGLEADYVIVLGLVAGRLGFPTEIADDPLLGLVLSEPETYPNAEERRLLYVALTRARRAVYLLAAGPPSPFLQELMTEGYDVTLFGALSDPAYACFSCRTGRLVRRTGSFGSYFACTAHPRCDYAEAACPACGKGLVSRPDRSRSPQCLACATEHAPCPRCSCGWLQTRLGKHGSFLGCSTYPRCRHTVRLDDAARTRTLKPQARQS